MDLRDGRPRYDGEPRFIGAPRALRGLLEGYDLNTAPTGLHWRFVDDVAALAAAGHGGWRAVALPAFTQAQAQDIRTVARRNPLLVIIGVVSDPTGRDTYNAISSGATLVLNTLIREERYLRTLCHLARFGVQASWSPGPPAVEGPHRTCAPVGQPPASAVGGYPLAIPPAHPRDAPDGDRLAGSGEAAGTPGTPGIYGGADGEADHRVLLELLRQGHTTREIARRLHCSERSMYRRLRRLYQRYGVTSRSDICRLLRGGRGATG